MSRTDGNNVRLDAANRRAGTWMRNVNEQPQWDKGGQWQRALNESLPLIAGNYTRDYREPRICTENRAFRDYRTY